MRTRTIEEKNQTTPIQWVVARLIEFKKWNEQRKCNHSFYTTDQVLDDGMNYYYVEGVCEKCDKEISFKMPVAEQE